MSVQDAATALCGGRTKIYQLIDTGWLQTFTIGSRRYIVRESFDEMVEAAKSGIDVFQPRSKPTRRGTAA